MAPTASFGQAAGCREHDVVVHGLRHCSLLPLEIVSICLGESSYSLYFYVCLADRRCFMADAAGQHHSFSGFGSLDSQGFSSEAKESEKQYGPTSVNVTSKN